MKILYYTNPPYTVSGYGRCCRWISKFLKEDGHEVGIAPNVAFGPGTIDLDGMTVHAQGAHFSEEPTIWHYVKNNYECLLFQYDIWAMRRMIDLIRSQRVVFVPYVPLDHAEIHPIVIDKLKVATYIIAMCKYGLNQLIRAGFKNSVYIHHGVDCNVYKPIYNKEGVIPREQLKQELGFEPDAFVIGLIKMNKGLRSALPEQLEIIKMFIDQNPDIKTRIYMHTEVNSEGGYNLEMVLNMLGMGGLAKAADIYKYFAGGYSDIGMAKIYNACDVTMACTYSEGFGMPVPESMACGTPVVAGDYTSMTEILQPITPELLVKPLSTIWQQIPAHYFLANKDKAVEALEKVANADPDFYAKKLAEYTKKTFDWATVIGPQWKQFFKTTLPEYMEENCINIPTASEYLKKRATPIEINTGGT
jgi:glycosyltransferase involved in cell wall biosynthesis